MKHGAVLAGTSALVVAASGCVPGLALLGTGPTGAAGDVAAKAEAIAARVGGQDGFGGTQMNGYRQHMGAHMGFDDAGDLADPNGQFIVRFHNDSDQECTFRFVYAASHMGLDDQMIDVTVAAGQAEAIEVPCAEMVGLGSMTEVGTVACELEDGTTFDNRMCVPGFMHSDYGCGGAYDCFFGPDTNDVDGDGDTGEMMASTEALYDHMGMMEMMGHGHRP